MRVLDEKTGTGERKDDALIKVIKEELDIKVKIEKYLSTVDSDHLSFHQAVHCYICSLVNVMFK